MIAPDTVTLIQAAQAGDKEACGRLVEENLGLIWSIVKRYTRKTVDNDDLYQLGIQLLYFFLQSVLLTFQTADLALTLLILTLRALLRALFLFSFLLNFFPCLCLHIDRLYSDRCRKHNCCYFFPVMISHPYLPFSVFWYSVS